MQQAVATLAVGVTASVLPLPSRLIPANHQVVPYRTHTPPTSRGRNEFTDCVFESNWLHALFISAADLQAHGCAFRRNAVLQGSVDARGGALMLLDSVEGSAVSVSERTG